MSRIPPAPRPYKARNRPNPVRLPEKLLRIRKRFGLSQTGMIRVVIPDADDSSRARISQYERGSRVPSLLEVLNYAKFAKVSMEVLVDDNQDLPF